MLLEIKKIYISKLSKDNPSKYIKIKNHPYYISLLNSNRQKYEKYIQISKYQSKKPSSKWENLIDIYNDISKNGFDFSKDKITIVKKHGKMVCIHGKHRICMLTLIHYNTILAVENNTVVGISF